VSDELVRAQCAESVISPNFGGIAITPSRIIRCGMCGRRIPVAGMTARGVVTCSCGLRIDYAAGERKGKNVGWTLVGVLAFGGIATALFLLMQRLG
jgi:hypothetical protein